MKKRFMKAAALFIVFTFVATSIDPVAFANPSAAGEVSPFSSKTLSIPAEFGQITDMITGDSSAPAFIHIQSAHGNYEAEKNIEKLLGYIETNSKVRLMLLEGAADKLHPEMFRIFPKHPDFNRKVTDKLMQEGYLTGPESFLIESEMKFEGFGMEDLDDYKADRDAFISVVKKKKTSEKFLGSLRAAVDKRFAAKLNKDLLNLVRQEEAFGSGTVSFEAWLKVLGEASKKHIKIDLADAFYQDQYPFLIRYYRLQAIGSKINREMAHAEAAVFLAELEKRKISHDILSSFKTILNTPESGLLKTGNGYSTLRRAFESAFTKLTHDFSMKTWPAWTLYAQYVILMQELEAKGLHGETSKLKDQILEALAKTPAEKEYLSKARELYLLRRLFDLELTRMEYEELRTRNITTSEFNQSKGSEQFSVLLAEAIRFYGIAVDRENKMFQNALKKMSELKQNRAVIVTGGFHAEGLKQLAASKGCSYIQITPRITEISKRDHEVYLHSMLGSRDMETSQIQAFLTLADSVQRVFVTGREQARAWFADVRRSIREAISIEPVSEQGDLSVAFSNFANSIFGSPTPALVPVRGSETMGKMLLRSEARNPNVATTTPTAPEATKVYDANWITKTPSWQEMEKQFEFLRQTAKSISPTASLVSNEELAEMRESEGFIGYLLDNLPREPLPSIQGELRNKVDRLMRASMTYLFATNMWRHRALIYILTTQKPMNIAGEDPLIFEARYAKDQLQRDAELLRLVRQLPVANVADVKTNDLLVFDYEGGVTTSFNDAGNLSDLVIKGNPRIIARGRSEARNVAVEAELAGAINKIIGRSLFARDAFFELQVKLTAARPDQLGELREKPFVARSYGSSSTASSSVSYFGSNPGMKSTTTHHRELDILVDRSKLTPRTVSELLQSMEEWFRSGFTGEQHMLVQRAGWQELRRNLPKAFPNASAMDRLAGRIQRKVERQERRSEMRSMKDFGVTIAAIDGQDANLRVAFDRQSGKLGFSLKWPDEATRARYPKVVVYAGHFGEEGPRSVDVQETAKNGLVSRYEAVIPSHVNATDFTLFMSEAPLGQSSTPAPVWLGYNYALVTPEQTKEEPIFQGFSQQVYKKGSTYRFIVNVEPTAAVRSPADQLRGYARYRMPGESGWQNMAAKLITTDAQSGTRIFEVTFEKKGLLPEALTFAYTYRGRFLSPTDHEDVFQNRLQGYELAEDRVGATMQDLGVKFSVEGGREKFHRVVLTPDRTMTFRLQWPNAAVKALYENQVRVQHGEFGITGVEAAEPTVFRTDGLSTVYQVTIPKPWGNYGFRDFTVFMKGNFTDFGIREPESVWLGTNYSVVTEEQMAQEPAFGGIDEHLQLQSDGSYLFKVRVKANPSVRPAPVSVYVYYGGAMHEAEFVTWPRTEEDHVYKIDFGQNVPEKVRLGYTWFGPTFPKLGGAWGSVAKPAETAAIPAEHMTGEIVVRRSEARETLSREEMVSLWHNVQGQQSAFQRISGRPSSFLLQDEAKRIIDIVSRAFSRVLESDSFFLKSLSAEEISQLEGKLTALQTGVQTAETVIVGVNADWDRLHPSFDIAGGREGYIRTLNEMVDTLRAAQGAVSYSVQQAKARSEARTEVAVANNWLPVRYENFVGESSALNNLNEQLRVAKEVVGNIVAIGVTKLKSWAVIAKAFFSDHFQMAATVPATFAKKWPVFDAILAHSATASTERMVIDERQGVPDAASVLPLATFALYNPKASVVLALIADVHDVDAFTKELAALSPKGALPQNLKVQAFASENEFVGAFAGFYNSAAPFGKSVALVTDRAESLVTRKISARRSLLSVVGAQNPLKQTASALLAADKLLDESIWSRGYHFVSVEKLGGLEALMAELASYVAAQAKVLASA